MTALRADAAGACAFNRGNNRGNLFFEERNYRHFLRLYANYVLPVADTYA